MADQHVVQAIAIYNPNMQVMRMVCKNWNRWLHDAQFISRWNNIYVEDRDYCLYMGGKPYDGLHCAGIGKKTWISEYHMGKIVQTYVLKPIETGYSKFVHVYVQIHDDYCLVAFYRKEYGSNEFRESSRRQIRTVDGIIECELDDDNGPKIAYIGEDILPTLMREARKVKIPPLILEYYSVLTA